jgi:branched-chain amino acid transport system substrate-binding protein
MATRSAALLVASTLPLKRIGANVGDTTYRWQLSALPDDFPIMFFAGIREGAYNVKDLQALALKQLFSSDDVYWSVDGFIKPSDGAAAQGEGVRSLSAPPAIGKVLGSMDSASRYTGKCSPINIAYARPIEWDENGDNKAAVIFVNVVDGQGFKEVVEIAGTP